MARRADHNQIQIPVVLDTNGLEGWLWEAACSMRGAVDAPKFKEYILPLIFVKRISDVFDNAIAPQPKVGVRWS